MDDGKIIELFFARSGDAVSELDKKYGRSMLALSKNILHNAEDAEECLNDAYLGIWSAIPPERPSPLSAYVHKIVRNISLKRYRRNTAQMRDGRNTVSIEEIADTLPYGCDVADKVTENELKDHLNSFLKTLNRTNLYIFMRKYWYFDSVGEIADRLGMTEAAVYLRLDRMKKNLKKYLSDKGAII